MFCSRCGKENLEAARFCVACGQALASESPSSVVPPSAQMLSTAATAEPRRSAGDASAPGPVGSQFGGFWIRFAAATIDSVIMGGLTVLGAVVLGVLGLLVGYGKEGAVGGYFLSAFFGGWLYPALSESSSRQATLGKRAVGVIVTDTAGRRISFGRATGRVFSKILNGLTLGVGWVMVGLSAQKRGLHDLIAGTLVVKHGPTRSNVVAAVVCCVAAIPLFGIMLAIAVPGLLRARMAGNETAAIGSLQAINSAQQAYLQACGGYAPNLPALASPTRFLSADLTGAGTVSKSGYQVTLRPASDGLAVLDAPRGCEGAVTAYVARAVPVTAGSSGVRYFTTNATGTIYWDINETFANATVLK